MFNLNRIIPSYVRMMYTTVLEYVFLLEKDFQVVFLMLIDVIGLNYIEI